MCVWPAARDMLLGVAVETVIAAVLIVVGLAGVLLPVLPGLSLIVVGTLVGGLFAAFSLAISAFSVPMMLSERVDAFTAMGTSMALVWNNLPVMLTWGALVLGLTLLGIVTGLVGLIVVFPVLGHGTWHAYLAMRSA